MTLVHRLLGLVTILLNLACLRGLAGKEDPEFWRLANLAHGALLLQIVSGFFLLTGTMGLSLWHYLLPTASALLVGLARAVRGSLRPRAVALASLLVAGAGVYSYLTGVGAAGG